MTLMFNDDEIVIEHNRDGINASERHAGGMPPSEHGDHVIDLGPGGGVNGGKIVVTGTPEDVAAEPKSFTGQYLKPLLERASVQPMKPQPAKKSRKRSSSEDQPDLIAAK
jgi:hypothetical protein